MAKIFISHSSKDKHFVQRLSQDLKAAGHAPWLDVWEIKVGQSIVTKVTHGIEDADYAIIVLTSDSVSSGWVDREWKTIYWSEINENKVKILPALLRNCEIPALLRTKRYADFTSRYETGLVQLLDALSTDSPDNAPESTPLIGQNPRVAKFTKLAAKDLSVTFESVTTGELVAAEVSANLQVGELKRLVMEEMALSDQFLDGRIASTQIYSRTQGMVLDDRLSLEESDVQDGEILRLQFFADAG